MSEDEFAPCWLTSHDDGTLSLCFDDFDAAAEVFEEVGYEGGGYGWHGVVEALVAMRASKLKRQLRYDPEASMFCVVSRNRDALRAVAGLIRAAVADPALLREALGRADPEIMEG
jgi:Immunity protein 51